VLISAALSRSGTPAQILLRWLGGELEIIVSPLLLAELERVLRRPKLRRHLSERDALAYVALLARRGILVQDPQDRERIAPDPNDDNLIALAQASGARFIVSGDLHLTALKDRPVRVITPRGMLQVLDLIGP
jgi:putative PIN family toxin of toxin-antitoxin system